MHSPNSTHLDVKDDIVVFDAVPVHLLQLVVLDAVLVQLGDEVEHWSRFLKLDVESERPIVLSQIHV